MGSVSPAQVSDGTTIDASDVNNPINTIANEFNGNIDNTNIKAAAAITGSKLADNSIDITTKASSWDGWVQVTDTWTYASSTTVTVPSDATAKYSVGDKVKFTNGSTKYFYITAVSATVLTLNGGTDYTVANSAISGVYYSKAATPIGFPHEFNFTPVWTNLTVGSGTNTGVLSIVNKLCRWRVHFVYGAGSAVGTNPSLTLPITANSSWINTIPQVTRDVLLLDSGTNIHPGQMHYASTTSGAFYCEKADATYAYYGGITSLIPFTWATSDGISANGIYPIA